MKTVVGIETLERSETLARAAWWLWVVATAALLAMASLEFVVSLLNTASVDSGDEMARAAILLASAALVYVGGRAARHVMGDD
jgi:4-amino-4-deoxy-L-arabinose transferase-like glycosyltransferase